MKLFDFLKGGARQETPGAKTDRKLDSLIRNATDKRAQQYDRDDALRKLVTIGTAEAAEGLLKRFSIKVDPSITDEDEKQLAYDGIVAIGQGQNAAHEPEDQSKLRMAVLQYTRNYCKNAENLTWAVKVFSALESDSEYELELLELLASHDTEYTRNVEPKVNLLSAAEVLRGAASRCAVERYLGDVNETVRFHAVHTLFDQADVAAIPALVTLLGDEESVRIKNKVAEGFVRLGWRVPETLHAAFRSGLADSYQFRMRDDGGVDKN